MIAILGWDMLSFEAVIATSGSAGVVESTVGCFWGLDCLEEEGEFGDGCLSSENRLFRRLPGKHIHRRWREGLRDGGSFYRLRGHTRLGFYYLKMISECQLRK